MTQTQQPVGSKHSNEGNSQTTKTMSRDAEGPTKEKEQLKKPKKNPNSIVKNKEKKPKVAKSQKEPKNGEVIKSKNSNRRKKNTQPSNNSSHSKGENGNMDLKEIEVEPSPIIRVEPFQMSQPEEQSEAVKTEAVQQPIETPE